MSSLINESEIIIWDKPVDTAEVLEKLVKSACNNGLACDFTTGLVSVREREEQVPLSTAKVWPYPMRESPVWTNHLLRSA